MSEPGRRRIDEIGEESRRRILDAAEELFAERGFERTSFVDVAERSGISRGSIPWHFKNKDGLVMAVVVRAIERMMDPRRYRGVPPPLAELFDDTAEMVRSGNSALLFALLPQALGEDGTVREQYRDFLVRRRDGIEEWIWAHRPAGVDPEVAKRRERDLAAALNGALLGIHLQAIVDPGGFDLDGALRSIATLVSGNLDDVWKQQDRP